LNVKTIIDIKKVSKAAKSAFETAFPEGKRTDVYVFCKNELLTNFLENLKTTPQSISESKNTTAEVTLDQI
jgi:ribonuclease I